MSDITLVTGGTGRLGRHVVAVLRDRGVAVRATSRHPEVRDDLHVELDLTSDRGLPHALEGVATVVHCATDRRHDVEFARRLLSAAALAGVTHFVSVSIVGAEASGGYGARKKLVEDAMADSGIPWSLVRSTQFFDFVASGLSALSRLPLVPVPRRFPTRPVDARDVADVLADLATSAPAGRTPDLGGPEEKTFEQLTRSYLTASGRAGRRIVPVPFGSAAIAAGALLPTSTAGAPRFGTRTWEEFLAERFRTRAS